MPKNKQQYSILPPEKVKSKRSNETLYRCRFSYYDVNGKRHQSWSQSLPSIEDCIENAKQKIHNALNDGSIVSNNEITLSQVIDKYCEYLNALPLSKTVKATTKATHLSSLHSLPVPSTLLKKKMKLITNADLNDWLNYILTKKNSKTDAYYSKVTIDKKFNIVRKIFLFAKNNLGLYDENMDRFFNLYTQIDKNFFDVNIQRPKKKRNDRYMNPVQFRDFQRSKISKNGFLNENFKEELAMTNCFNRDYMYYILFEVFYYTGARTSEIKALTRQDIIFDYVKQGNKNIPRASIYITKSYSDKATPNDRKTKDISILGLKTIASERVVPVYDPLYQELIDYIEYCNNFNEGFDYLLFPGSTGSFLSDNAIDNQLKKRLKNVTGLEEFSKHDFRRTRITDFLNSGLTPQEIEFFIGHGSLDFIKECYNSQTLYEKYNNLSNVIMPKNYKKP